MLRLVGKILTWLIVLVLVVFAGAVAWLYVFPPALIQVAAGYSAKMVCSNVFVAGRDPVEVLKVDVQAPGHPILGLISEKVDREGGTVLAELMGVFGGGLALARPNAGCSSVPDGDLSLAALPEVSASAAPAPAGLWPQGEDVQPWTDAVFASILDDPRMVGPGMRALVVVHDGRIVGERYGEGFTEQTPLLGWSMTKTVTAAILGTLVHEGRITLDQDALVEGWTDERSKIRIADLMAMSSALEFNEDYGDVTDVTRMLYLEPDMAAFAADKPLVGEVGKVFSYSSGTTVLLSRIWQNALGDSAEALAWPRRKLFDPLGMRSAVLELDARGTYVGSSYLYATARDWARFGQFLLQDGRWNGQQILPSGFVAWMREPAPASQRAYGRGQVWLRGPSAGTPEGENPDRGFELPADTFWLLGHDGQSMAVVPSLKLVVLRMGLTPSKLGYKSQQMLEAISKVLPKS